MPKSLSFAHFEGQDAKSMLTMRLRRLFSSTCANVRLRPPSVHSALPPFALCRLASHFWILPPANCHQHTAPASCPLLTVAWFRYAAAWWAEPKTGNGRVRWLAPRGLDDGAATACRPLPTAHCYAGLRPGKIEMDGQVLTELQWGW